MRIERLYDAEEDMIRALIAEQDAGQEVRGSEPGFHVSGLVRGWAVQNRLLPSAYDAEVDVALTVREKWVLGEAWEDLLAQTTFRRLGHRVEKVPALWVKDVTGKPDGIDPQSGDPVEMKCSWWNRDHHPVETLFLYQAQLMAYVYMLGLEAGQLWMVYLNGNYRPPTPDIHKYRFIWTRVELERNWNQLMAVREQLVAAGKDRI